MAPKFAPKSRTVIRRGGKWGLRVKRSAFPTLPICGKTDYRLPRPCLARQSMPSRPTAVLLEGEKDTSRKATCAFPCGASNFVAINKLPCFACFNSPGGDDGFAGKSLLSYWCSARAPREGIFLSTETVSVA